MFVSVQITNMTYRVKVLNQDWEISNRIKLLEKYDEQLKKISTNYAEDEREKIKSIQFFLEHSVNDFISGDFETSYLNSFKILFDQRGGNYVYRNIYQIERFYDLRGNFATIRNNLVHSRDSETLKQTRKSLFKNSLELLHIVKWDFMDKFIAESLEN